MLELAETLMRGQEIEQFESEAGRDRVSRFVEGLLELRGESGTSGRNDQSFHRLVPVKPGFLHISHLGAG